MKYYTSGDSQNPFHVLQFDPGDDLLEGVNAFIADSGLTDGAVISGIGTLDQAVLHMVTTIDYPPVEVHPHWVDTALELASMQGIIADGKPHIHMTISDKTTATAGHLEPGCRVLYLAEMVVQEFSNLSLTRVPNDRDILKIVPKE